MENDEALPLHHLQKRLTASTYAWLVQEEEKEQNIQKELEDDEAAIATAMFTQWYDEKFSKKSLDCNNNEDDAEGGEDHDEEDSVFQRVHEWCSSRMNPDGIGGTNEIQIEQNIQEQNEHEESFANNKTDSSGTNNDVLSFSSSSSSLKIKYILSEASGGHGDDLWAASRHIANVFAYEDKCRQLFTFDHDTSATTNENYQQRRQHQNHHHHPLKGLDFIELGAGGGVPSWIAMKCGARVICTDQSIPNRIRCIAECAQRNLQDMKLEEIRSSGEELKEEEEKLFYAEQVKAHPYDWGESVDDIISIINTDNNHSSTRNQTQDTNNDNDCNNNKNRNNPIKLFDIIVAADCIYMPEYHKPLLTSIHKLLSPSTGIALLPFALHGNTKDENVWSIVDVAKEMGFCVDVLESHQLTPQGAYMDSKRALVNMLRLTKT